MQLLSTSASLGSALHCSDFVCGCYGLVCAMGWESKCSPIKNIKCDYIYSIAQCHTAMHTMKKCYVEWQY
jgi:hypothetical protein